MPELVAAARQHAAVALVVAQADPDQIDDRILHRHLDMLAAPGLMALLQCGENADRHVHAGAAVADRRQHDGRRVLREAGHAIAPPIACATGS